MQVQTTTNTVDYTTATKEATKTNKVEITSDVKFDMSKPFDIDSFTFNDYKNISDKDLETWIKSSNLPNQKEVENKVAQLTFMTSLTEDDTFNEVMFDKLNESYNTRGESLFSSVIMPLAGPVIISEENSALSNSTISEAFKKDSNNWTTTLSGGGERTSDYYFKAEDLLSKMKNFPELYEKTQQKGDSILIKTENTYQAFNEIIADYTKRKDEQNATLDAYTRNTKQNPVLV